MSTPRLRGPRRGPPGRWPRRASRRGILLRNGEQLLLALVCPAAVLLGLAMTSSLRSARAAGSTLPCPACSRCASSPRPSPARPSPPASTAATACCGCSAPRRSGAAGCSAAKAVAVLCVEAVQVVVIGGLGLALGWDPRWRGIPAARWSPAARHLGVRRARRCCSAGRCAPRRCSPLANLALGGCCCASAAWSSPPRASPDRAWPPRRLLPSGALGDGLRAAFLHGRLGRRALAGAAGLGAARQPCWPRAPSAGATDGGCAPRTCVARRRPAEDASAALRTLVTRPRHRPPLLPPTPPPACAPGCGRILMANLVAARSASWSPAGLVRLTGSGLGLPHLAAVRARAATCPVREQARGHPQLHRVRQPHADRRRRRRSPLARAASPCGAGRRRRR